MSWSSEMPGVGGAALDGMQLRVLLAESDVVSCRIIRSVLEDEPDVTLDHIDHSQLIASIHERAPDVVIVDVHTPAIRTAPSWESLGVTAPAATIVTTYDARWASRFAARATDLLVKPFDGERFLSALDLARARIVRPTIAEQGRLSGIERTVPRTFLERLAVEEGEKILLVRTADIEWMQSSGNHIRIHVGKVSHRLRQSMKNVQSLLDPNHFVRVHRNAIVNLDHVEEFHLPSVGNMFVKLRNGFCLPLRKSSRTLLRKMLTKIS